MGRDLRVVLFLALFFSARSAFGQTPVPTPTPAPLTIVSPLNGSTVSASVTVKVTTTLSVTDDWWNSLAVDGISTGLTDTGHYQAIFWNSATVPNGSHRLTVS